jgi:hypothetical protein
VAEEEKRAAQKMFEAGDGLYESGRYEEATVAFKNSHDLAASPNSRLMLARSLREAGHHEQACTEFRATIQDAEASFGRYPEALQAARSELDALESLMTTDPHPAEANAVSTAVTTAVSTKPVATSDLGAEKPTRALPSPQKDSPQRAKTGAQQSTLSTAAWASAGVGVVGIATFGIFGYLNNKTYSDLESSCRSVCPADSESQIERGRSYQLLGNIGLGVAIVGTAAATTLFVLAPKRSHATETVAVRMSVAGLVIRGGF